MPPRASGPSIAAMLRACWAARTSVGASSAACPPASTACSMARSATTVLPDPTSPCSSRCIGWVAAELGVQHLAHDPLPLGQRRTAASRRTRRATRRPAPGAASPASRPLVARRWARTTWTPNASSQRSRCERAAHLPPVLGMVDPAQGRGALDHAGSGPQVLVERVGEQVHHRQNEGHHVLDGPGVDLVGGRVDRDRAIGEVLRDRSRRLILHELGVAGAAAGAAP